MEFFFKSTTQQWLSSQHVVKHFVYVLCFNQTEFMHVSSGFESVIRGSVPKNAQREKGHFVPA